jgi:hypothetical protein
MPNPSVESRADEPAVDADAYIVADARGNEEYRNGDVSILLSVGALALAKPVI